jgi:TonB family protein
MFLSSIHENASRNIPCYVFEIQQVLRRENLPVGTQYAMLAIAECLTNGTELRTNLGRVLRAIIHREDGRIYAMELLSLILMASASPVDPLPGVRMERAMHETLGFILEVRQQLEDSGEGDPGESLVHGKERLTSWPQPLLLEKLSLGGQGRVVLILALCGLLAALAVAGFSRRGQQVTENASAQARALPNSDSGNASNPVASVVSSARGNESLLSHNSRLRSKKAIIQSLKRSETPTAHSSQNAPPTVLATPIGESRLLSSRVSANDAVPSVSSSTIGLTETLPGPAQQGTSAAADVSTAVVAPPSSISRANTVARSRGLVQSGLAGIMAANLISSPSPAYPAAASDVGVQGEVTVNALVGKDGNVLSATIVSGPPLLREAAIRAVEQWKFHPFLISGKPAIIAATAIVDFELTHD